METISISEDQLKEVSCVQLSDSVYGGYKQNLVTKSLTAIEKNAVICPSCKGIKRESSDCCENPNLEMLESIDKLPAKCPLEGKGCTWRGQLGAIKTHLAQCKSFQSGCPYARFGCKFESTDAVEIEKHEADFVFKHLEMRMRKIESNNSNLEASNRKIEKQLSTLLNKANISKFVETRKQCLEGVEWRVVPTHTAGQLEGPSFYIRGYHLQVVGKVGEYLRYHVRRIPGEFDEGLPPAQLTFTSAELVGREKARNISHNHPLKISALSEEIDHGKCSSSDFSFYFEIEMSQ